MLSAHTSGLEVCLDLTNAISRSTQLEPIYEAALDALNAGLNIERAAILLFDPDGVIRFKAWRGLSAQYRRAVEGHSPWSPGQSDATPLVVSDAARDASLTPFRAALDAEHIAALTFIPLNGPTGVIGKFMLYAGEPWTPSIEQLQLASIIAAQIAFAVERMLSYLAAADNEQRLRFALDAAHMCTWEWDLGADSFTGSDNFEQVHGLTSGTLNGSFSSYLDQILPDDRQAVLASAQRAVAEGTPYRTEYRVALPGGGTRWIEGKGHVDRGGSAAAMRLSGVCMDVTPRKSAELARIDALEQSAALAHRLAAIVESSDDAIVSKDLNGTVMSWNGAAERMFGYSAEEAIGKSITIIIPKERLAEEDLVLSHVRAGKPISMETVRQRKDGSTLEIALTVSPVRSDDGTVIGVSKIARDISRRKANEAQLADLQQRLMQLLDASASLLDSPETAAVENRTVAIARELLVADGYAVWRRDLNTDGWHMVASEGISEAFTSRTIAGSTSDVVEPLAIVDVFSAPALAAQADAYRAEGIASVLVCPLRSAGALSGTLVFYYRSPRTFSDVEIRTAQAFANLAASAITTAHLYADQQRQRKAAELASVHSAFLSDATTVLAQSLDYEKTLRTIAQMAVPQIADWCAVDILNDDGRLERLAVAHIDPEKVQYARQIEERYPPAPDTPGGTRAVVSSGKPQMVAVITAEMLDAAARDEAHRQLLHTLAPTSYMCVPLTLSGRTVGAMTFVFADSGRHYAERDLAFASDVATRASLAIANAHAYRRAREANQMKDAFIATLSHELRTPLNAILGYAQMLSMGLLEGERRSRAIAVVTRNAASLRQIIDDVLDVSRMTTGKLHLAMETVDLGAIISNACATVQPAADAKGVATALAVDAKVPPVFADPERLQQVIWNLLSNAVKFTPRGGRVDVRVTAAADHRVEIVVRDTGQGIDAGFLPHVFERFRQADSRFSRQHGGLGLGLSIVHELVELHGGEVDAASDGPGKGATFTVRLPIVSARDAEAADAAPPHAAAATSTAADSVTHRLDGVRILAVDDEEDALGLLRVILETAGATVTTVPSAMLALDALQRERFDTLIADIGMPDGDGLELIRTIRQTLPAPENRIPAAALTAYARSEDRVAALASGFQMHLAKPINPSELIAALTTLVQRLS